MTRLAYLLMFGSSWLVAVLIFGAGYGTNDPMYLTLQIGSLLAAWFSLRAFLYSFKALGDKS